MPPPYLSRTFPGIIGRYQGVEPEEGFILIGRNKRAWHTVRRTVSLAGESITGAATRHCASEALAAALGTRLPDIFKGRVLDAGLRGRG